MGNRRRGSQAFKFEQSQETLQQNESIVNLYKNKTFVPPDAKEFETINEEGNEFKGQRAKRGHKVTDGSLVLGVNKAKRFFEEYKFWKQDDKERNKRRKQMITKLWKGRKRTKHSLLDPAQEQKLIDLIADRESSSEEEDESSPSKRRKVTIVQQLKSPNNCVWEAISEGQTEASKHPSTSSSDMDHGATCVWSNRMKEDSQSSQDPVESYCGSQLGEQETVSLEDSFVPLSKKSSLGHEKSLRRKSSLNQSQSMEFSRRRSSVDSTAERELQHNTMFELQGIIPDSELAELLATDDLLFCADKKPSNDVPVLGNIQNVESNIQKDKVQNSRKSIRRSARLMCQPGFAGSVFNYDSQNQNVDFPEQSVDGKENFANFEKRKSKKHPPVIAPQTSDCQSNANISKETLNDCQGKKKRRSYSLDDGKGKCSRYSLDGSKKNSLLTVTGDMEINISMPDSVRRSFSAIDVSSCHRTTPENISVSPHIENNVPAKFSLPKPFFCSSDSDEEEVIVSGNIRKRNFMKSVKSRKRVIH